jgi:glycosyltransferase involved in cell wall biosynthesis
MSTRISVIIPTWNRWPRVAEAVDSVLAQTEPAHPVVVDDASTDDTPRRLRERFGDRCEVIVQPENREKSAARNTGLQAAGTDYVAFLDSDDLLTPTAMAALLAVFAADPAFDGVAYGACTVGDRLETAPADLPRGRVLHAYVRNHFLHTPSCLYPRQRLVDLGGYREDLTNLEDVELFIRLMSRCEFRPCAEVVCRIRKQPDAASADHAAARAQGRRLLTRLQEDETAMAALGDDFAVVEYGVLHELLRACYKCGAWHDYCELFAELRARFPERLSARMRRRHWRARVGAALGPRRS